MISHSIEQEVPFFDVDSMDIVWHGHYVKYLELARCALLDKIGYNYRDMRESGFSFPIVDMRIKYVKPLTFGQQIRITASLKEWEYRIKILYRIFDGTSDETHTKAETVQAAIDMKSLEMRLECPAIFREKVLKHLGNR